MPKEIRLPQLGQTMEEGTIVTVLLKEGDEIAKGDVIFEVETDKATLEMESPAEGFVKNILVSEGQTVNVNAAMAVLGEKDEEVPQSFIDSLSVDSSSPVEEKVEVETEEAAKPAAEPPKQAQTPVKKDRIFASPRAKKAAKELGIDLTTVKPQPGAARITEQDVRNAAQASASVATSVVGVELPEPAYKLGEKVTPSRLQKITGQKMLQSKQEIPCFYLTTEVDATELVKHRADVNAAGNVKVAFNDFIIRAVAIGLKHFPILTGQLVDGYIQLAENINIGLAISVKDGLVAPLIKDADKKTPAQLASYAKELIERARNNKLGMDDLQGGCCTVSNLGGFGITSFIPIVVPGQCSILGVGKIADTCVPIDGNIMVRKMMSMTISVDHKVANGSDVAQFLDVVKKLLENPSLL